MWNETSIIQMKHPFRIAMMKHRFGLMAENTPKKPQNGGKNANICSRYVI